MRPIPFSAFRPQVLSPLPAWISITDHPPALQGVPLLSDFGQASARHNSSPKTPTCLHLDPEPTTTVCLHRPATSGGNSPHCWHLHIRVRSAWCPQTPTDDTAPPKLQILETNVCQNRQPLIAAVELAIRRFYLKTAQRTALWRGLFEHLAGPESNQSALGRLSEKNFHLWDAELHLNRTVYVLARAHKPQQNVNRSSLNMSDFAVIRAIWTIGCGFLDEDALGILLRLEERFITSPVIDDWLMLPEQHGPIQGVLLDWLVGDYQSTRLETRIRSRRQSAGFQEYAPIFASRVAGAVSEASGMAPPEHIAQGSYLKPDLTDAEGSQKLRLAQPLAPIEITVHQISNARIPPNTFAGPPGSHLRLRLFEHVYPMQFGVDSEASVGREIHRDINSWVSFDSTNEILRLRPLPEHVGNHNFVLCAYDNTDAKVCAPLTVKVRSTSPIKKSFILQVPPGVFWCNQIPLYWFEELKLESLDDIELTVTGDSPFSWSQKGRQLCVITKLRTEQIMTFFFRGNNPVLAQVVEVEFRISVKVPPTEKLICSPRVHLKLRWTDKSAGYEAREISRLNASLAQALRIRVNPSIIPQNIFVYDIIQLRNFGERQMTASSVWLEVELVYLPLGLPDASTAETLGLLEQLMERPQSGPYLTHLAERQRFGRLLGLCENARLDGCVPAVQAAADSFHPFVVEEVGVLPVDGAACERAFTLEKKLRTAGERTLSPPGSTSTAGGGDEEKAFAGLFPLRESNPPRLLARTPSQMAP
nr:unnamed protein product [Spirometra erinaceieuropaei]